MCIYFISPLERNAGSLDLVRGDLVVRDLEDSVGVRGGEALVRRVLKISVTSNLAEIHNIRFRAWFKYHPYFLSLIIYLTMMHNGYLVLWHH